MADTLAVSASQSRNACFCRNAGDGRRRFRRAKVIGVLPGRTPLYPELRAGGVLTYVANGEKKVVAVYGGFVEVLPDPGHRFLADMAENKEEIDLNAARSAKG